MHVWYVIFWIVLVFSTLFLLLRFLGTLLLFLNDAHRFLYLLLLGKSFLFAEAILNSLVFTGPSRVKSMNSISELPTLLSSYLR
jgi:hypothetical protein